MFKRAIVTVNGLMIGLDTLTISKKVATVCQEFFFLFFSLSSFNESSDFCLEIHI